MITYKCKTCKTVVFIKQWVRTVRVRRSAPKSVPFPEPKNGVKIFRKSQVRLQQKKQFLSHWLWLRLARARALRCDSRTASRHVAHAGAAGAHRELRAQTRPPWRKCLRAGARARLRGSARGHARVRTRSHTDARFAEQGRSQKNLYAVSEYDGQVRSRYSFLPPATEYALLRFPTRVALVSSLTRYSLSSNEPFPCMYLAHSHGHTGVHTPTRTHTHAHAHTRTYDWEKSCTIPLLIVRQLEFADKPVKR